MVMSTLTIHCQWEDETMREKTGHPDAEAKKMKFTYGANPNLPTSVHLNLTLPPLCVDVINRYAPWGCVSLVWWRSIVILERYICCCIVCEWGPSQEKVLGWFSS